MPSSVNFDGTYNNTKPQTTVSPIIQVLTEDHSVDATKSYIGRAERSTATTAAQWLVAEVTTTATGTSIKYASVSFDQIWDDRETLTYA